MITDIVNTLTMTKQEADEWEQEVSGSVNRLRSLLAVGYEREAWRALGYSNWTECLQTLANKYGFSERHAWRLHQANEASRNLLTPGSVEVIPEKHLRPLVGLPPEMQFQVWQEAIETAPNGRVTGEHVKRIVRERTELNNGIVQCSACNNLYDGTEIDHCPYCAYTQDERIEYLKNKTRPENIHVSDDSYEWYTPAEYIEAARVVMGAIDLDPASCAEANKTVKADEFYTQDDDGLSRDWFGCVWLNPPYNMPNVENFTARAHVLYQNKKVDEAIILVNNSTDAGWFHTLLDNYPVCLTRGRVKYWGPHASQARQGQAIFYLGKNKAAFVKEFSRFGIVVSKDDNQRP